MYQVLRDTNNVTDSGCPLCQCRSLIQPPGLLAVAVLLQVQNCLGRGLLLLSPVFEIKAGTSKSGNGVGRG